MYLDAFTISALVDEFLDTLVGGRVQDSLAVDQTGIGLEIYTNHRRQYLYLSADHLTPRVHLVPDKLRRGLTTPPLMVLLFRRYVEGGEITHISQPPWERILQFDVEGAEGLVSIIIEPMERRSNILLVQNGTIIDCMRRVGPDENRYRLSLPNHAYVPPPPQTGKHDPFTLTLADMVGIFEQNDDPKRKSQQVLSSRLLGISPLLAKEIIYRAGEDPNQKAADADPEGLLEPLQTLMQPLSKRRWQPGVVETDQGVEAYSVYPVKSLPGWHPVESANTALNAFYGAPVGEDAYNAAKIPVRDALHEAQTKVRAKLTSLERSLTDDAEREILRHSGELILAYQYTIAKKQTELRAQYHPDQPELVIALDPTLSPLENAQQYFTRYNKAKRALEDVPTLVDETRAELDYLVQLETDLALASNWSEIDEVQQVLQASGYWRGKTVKRMGGSGQSAPLKLVNKDGYVLWVGRNSRQNETVTFKHGGGEDFWLHAHGVPGSHVVIRFDGRRIPDKLVDQAAAIAAYYSASRGEGKVLVDVTHCKYVRKIKGAGPGMVTYRNEQPRTVVPQSEAILNE